MAVTEHIGLMTHKTEDGNLQLMYPITKPEAVDGLDELLDGKIPVISPAVAGNLAALKADGTLEDSGKKPGDFAPGGYGLGGTVAKKIADPDTALESGWYNVPYPDCTGWQGTGLLFVQSFDNIYKVQELHTLASPDGLMRRTRNSEGWSAWEWVNPPMSTGVEYRTTRRDGGKPVYVKCVRYQHTATIGSSSGVTDIKIPHGISGFRALTECFALKGIGTVMPYPSYKTIDGIPHYAMSGVTYIDSTNINLRIVNDTWSNTEWYFLLHYTKTT